MIDLTSELSKPIKDINEIEDALADLDTLRHTTSYNEVVDIIERAITVLKDLKQLKQSQITQIVRKAFRENDR